MKKRFDIRSNNQSGAALVIAMIMMIVLTLIGLASTFSSTFESRLSGNKRESTGAFFTAEAGLEAVKSTMTNFDTTVNYVDRAASPALPANLADEAIDLVRTSPNLNLPGGSTFTIPPTVTIYHLRAGGEGVRSYRSDRYIIDSMGRDQLGFGFSRCEIREKRLLRSLGPFSEMEN